MAVAKIWMEYIKHLLSPYIFSAVSRLHICTISVEYEPFMLPSQLKL